MNQKTIYIGIDKNGDLVEQEFIFREMIKGYSRPPHFDMEDYYEPPKYVTNQDYYE